MSDAAPPRPQDTEEDSTAAGYSRAFDRMVNGPEDTVGLLAYALFKQAIREDAADGRASPGNARNPSPTMVKVFRGNAERMLQEFASRAVEEATPEIRDENTIAAITAVEANLVKRIDARTHWRGAIATNLTAWVITLAVTVLVINMLYLPNWTADIAAEIQKGYQRPN